MQISRKDTVIIAVLINCALLSCLFALANRQDADGQKEEAKEQVQIVQEKVVQKEPELQPLELYAKLEEKNPVDEIDKVLQEYALKQKVVTVKEAPKKIQETKQEAKIAEKPKVAKKAKPEPKSSKKQDSQKEPEYYIIKKGDSPWTIAKKFHLKYEDLLAMNDLDEEKAKNLKIGKPIRIR